MENQPEVKSKQVWWKTKIAELEAKVAELEAQTITVSSSVSDYADGYVDCMHKYGILSKLQRRRIHEKIIADGIGAVKATKRSRFSLSVPSL